VPDFYQGTELWDLSLVDPDNRRPVDLPLRASLMETIGPTIDWRELASAWPDGRIKLALIERLLALRREFREVFANGSYRPLSVTGLHRDEIIAFARVHGRDAMIVACGRHFGRATNGGRRWPSPEAWDARVSLPGFSDFSNLLGGRATIAGSELVVSDVFDGLPVAVLLARHSE
jgi:(1->4)-alpha-D-glucan 1-alpha-D-glucosylmutase